MADRHQASGADSLCATAAGTRRRWNLPTHVRTPEGEELAVFGQELATEVGRRHGSPVEMMHLTVASSTRRASP